MIEPIGITGLRNSVPRRTLAGFIAALVALFAISFFSYRMLNERTELASRVTQTLTDLRHLENVLSLIKDAETGQRGFLLTGNASYLEPYENALLTLPRELAEIRSSLADDAAQSQRLAIAEELSREKLSELQRTVELQRSGQRTAALELVNSNRGKEIMDRMRIVVNEMAAAEQTQFEARAEALTQSQYVSSLLTWVGAGVLFVLILGAAVLSSRDFRQQQIETWLQRGQNHLSQSMQGEQELHQLGDTIARFLARFLDAQMAAVFMAEPSGNLRSVGAWGLSEDAVASRESLAHATGLDAQAFKDGRPVLLRNVPETYFSISSALGHKTPRHVIVIPTMFDGAANGVIELGFFRAIDPHGLQFLDRVAASVGVAFRSWQYRNDLRNLLEETQRQAEELQTQQEELKVSNEELEQQTTALQDSQFRLQSQQAELEQINAQLEEQTQSLERQRDALASAQFDLERASAYKSQFLANMSHELRTPLNSSLILAKLLVDNRDGNLTPEQVRFAQTIYSAGNDLLALINDILDLSKIEAGRLDVRSQSINVSRLVDELIDSFRPLANERQLDLSAHVHVGTPDVVESDPVRLLQILKNLVSNALKFTEHGGVSVIVASAGAGRLSFAVKDTGIGIPLEQQELIFEAFRQADGTATRGFGGTGLGLSISRDLARLLGGELTVESTPGHGSTFTLTLPERLADQSAVAKTRSRRTSTMTRFVAPAPAPSAAAGDDRTQLHAGRRSILIIEDDADFVRILQDLAHEREFQTLVARTAEEGLSLAARHRPSAVLLDVGLPDRSGLSVLDALKHDPATRHIPVHVISATDYTHAALEMGAAGYAVKPIQRERLVEAFRRLETNLTSRVRRVLVVEDDPVHRDSTCRLLTSDGVECVPVDSAAQALQQLASSTFDCMVLDLTLPDRSGFDLLEEMSSQEQYAFPPVIVYTGRSLTRDQEQALRRFSQSIIIKGARSPERLLDEVTLFLHQVEADLPADRQRMLRDARDREAVFDGRRVLVVEDDVRNIFALTSILEPKGAHVEIARNGQEALAHLRDKPGVDLVLMDVMMPEMDGLEATRQIRQQPQYAKLPIIALTAKAMSDDRANCLAAGANDYIAKPLDVDKLLSLARVWMPK